jgi:hypothetical protein
LKIPNGNQKPQIEEGQTIQVSKVKRQNDEQWSIQHYTENSKASATRIPQNTGSELGCPGRVGSSCSNSGFSRATLITKSMTSHEREKDGIVFNIFTKENVNK